jgi:hypothetical protein
LKKRALSIFYHEDGGSKFFRKVSKFIPTYNGVVFLKTPKEYDTSNVEVRFRALTNWWDVFTGT